MNVERLTIYEQYTNIVKQIEEFLKFFGDEKFIKMDVNEKFPIISRFNEFVSKYQVLCPLVYNTRKHHCPTCNKIYVDHEVNLSINTCMKCQSNLYSI
jgi:hypothetical protein